MDQSIVLLSKILLIQLKNSLTMNNSGALTNLLFLHNSKRRYRFAVINKLELQPQTRCALAKLIL